MYEDAFAAGGAVVIQRSGAQSERSDLVFEEWLDAFPSASVRLLVCADSRAAVSDRLAAWAQVVHPLARITDLEEMLFSVVESLAARAAVSWPHWYARHVSGFASSSDGHGVVVNDDRRRRVLRALPGVASRWLDDAIARAASGSLPIFRSIALETQIQQLVLALDQDELKIAMILEAHDRGPGLLRLARTADWLCQHSGARVLVVVPESCRGEVELDSIAYGSLVASYEMIGDAGEHHVPVRNVLRVLIGRPHHASAAEQRLAAAISAEPTLAPLFELNQRIETARGSVVTVDLIWRDAGLIIELDGWGTHGSREAFYADRHRDYELTLSGFRVVRLTDDEILTDISLAIDKIRDVVAFMRGRRTTP